MTRRIRQLLTGALSADSRYRFVEEGAAFAELEGVALARHAPPEAWNAIAMGFDLHVAPGEVELATAALRLAGLKPGDEFLDVAAGTGGLSLPAARLGARVLATDWAPKMIERFEARVREYGFESATGQVMDCHALTLPDDRFDMTGSQFGVMLVPAQAEALAEMVRVTKPGGRVVLISYGNPRRFEILQTLLGALGEVNPDFPGIPNDPPLLEFQVADPSVMEQRLRAAGLKEVFVDTSHEERVKIGSGRQLWDWCMGSNPIASRLVCDLTEAQKKQLLESLDSKLREKAKGAPFALLTAPLNIGIGTKS